MSNMMSQVDNLEEAMGVQESMMDDLHDKKYQNKGTKKDSRYYGILRGKFNNDTNEFFRGVINDKDEYKLQSHGVWRLVAFSSSDEEKVKQWMNDNAEHVDQENKEFFKMNLVKNGIQ